MSSWLRAPVTAAHWPLIALGVLLVASAPAQQEAQARVAPLPDGVTKHPDIAYAEIEGVDPQRLMLDLYRPEGAESAPIMLFIHGGGWSRGDRSAVWRKPEFFCGSGWLFASANYRFVPEVTPAEQVRDIARAVAWLRDNAAQFGGDPERIFLMGHSAGAHLVALVSTDPRPLEEAGLSLSALSGTVVIDTGTLDLEAHMRSVGARAALWVNVFGDDPEGWRPLSPLAQVAPDAGIPPFLLLMQGTRTRRENAQRFADALVMCGVEAEAVHLPGHTHASINRSVGEPGDPTTEAVAGFLSGLGAPVSCRGTD
ncbi:MAG: alpha/beta hydrolase [Armatimonadota bacterium]